MNAFVKVSNLVRESCVVDRIDCCTAVVRCDQVSVQTARQRAFLRSHSIPFNNVVQCSCSVCALGGVRGSAVGGLFKPNKRLKHGDIHLRLGQRNDRLFAASTQQRAKVMHVQCERPVSICFHCGCKWRLAFAPEIPLPNNPPRTFFRRDAHAVEQSSAVFANRARSGQPFFQYTRVAVISTPAWKIGVGNSAAAHLRTRLRQPRESAVDPITSAIHVVRHCHQHHSHVRLALQINNVRCRCCRGC